MSVRSDPVSEPVRIAASWYDGHSARRHEGAVHWDGGDSFVLDDGYGGRESIALNDLRAIDRQRDATVYSRTSMADFRLTLPKDLPAGFARNLPSSGNYGAWIDRHGLVKMSAVFAVVSAAAVALFLTAPEWLGPRIPESWERRMGDAMVGDFGGRVCHSQFGDEALAKLVAKVDPAREKVRVGVANIDMVNAVALPGGHVLIFDGLIQQAESPEEIAGVLAHEIGHVRERHVMTAMLRQFGLSILASGFNSGFAEGAFGVATLGYSREAEREADDYARARMRVADISPLGAAGFFDRMSRQYGDGEDQPAMTGWIATHPASGERARAYRDSAGRNAYPPVLSEQEFGALKTMCEEDENVEEFEFF